MKKITKEIGITPGNGIFHDSRGDVAALAAYCNMLASKINELIHLIDVINRRLDNGKGA
ncbi:MAG: hypothetical protein IJX77_10275 [Ruminococcus sp.]|nr:hypothetical protein [Ruminococcus sp.]